MLTEVTVPDIGEFKNIPIIEILVKPGDVVEKDSPLIILESDKATLEVPSPQKGIILELKSAVGERVSVGSIILTLETAARDDALPARAPPPQSMATSTEAAAASALVVPPVDPVMAVLPAAPLLTDRGGNVPAALNQPGASPSVRRFARELGVDLRTIKGRGPKGRILKEDLHSFVKAAVSAAGARCAADGAASLKVAPWPQVDFSTFGPVERMPLPRIRRIAGENLARNWAVIPHVTNFEDADITDLDAFRQRLNAEDPKSTIKVTMLAFLIKAVAATLGAYPQFNASLDGNDLILKRYCHIGFAADTPNGLVVPVIRDAATKCITRIASEVATLAGHAREGKLKLADMQGGCFTISSLGAIGGTGFTPIINAPEVAILGVARAQIRPVWAGKEFQPRLILPLTLSWDHRVVDGAAAARFLNHLARLLADFRRVLL